MEHSKKSASQATGGRNNAKTIVATIQNQGEKKPAATTAIPVAFPLLSPPKADQGPRIHTATNKAARALIVPLRHWRPRARFRSSPHPDMSAGYLAVDLSPA